MPRTVRAGALGMVAIGLVASQVAAAPPSKPPSPAAAPTAPAPAAPVTVESAEQLYAKLDYEQANAVADRLAKTRGLSHDQLVRTYRILAVTNAILDKEERAREAFFLLLTFDPEYQVDPNLGPKVNTPFMEARGSFRALPSKPGVEVAPSISTRGGSLRVVTRDPTRIVKKLDVGWRWTSAGEYTVSRVPAADVVTVDVGGAPAGRTRLDFYVQALDDSDNAVFDSGSPKVPKSTFAEAGAGGKGEKSEGSVFSSPLFWIFTGAAVIGGGTALFFALRSEESPSQATLSPVIFCGAERCR